MSPLQESPDTTSTPWAKVRAFASDPRYGNPALVCFPAAWPAPALMQAVAAAQGCSAAVFVVAQGDDFGIQWFAPAGPIEMCGHGTLAAAHILFTRAADRTHLRFVAPLHTLTAERVGARVRLTIPHLDVAAMPLSAVPATLAPAVLSGAAEAVYGNGTWVLILRDAHAVATYTPDLAALRRERLFVAVTAAGGATCDYVLRYFAPAAGTDEDPATGSVHSVLAPLWARRLGRTRLRAYQSSPSQGWFVTDVSPSQDRVGIEGQAIVIAHGDLPLADLAAHRQA